MSAELEQRAARLLTVGFPGTQLCGALEELLDRGVGGVVLFARNIDTPEQVASLVADIKRRAGRPLFVSVDQEGGAVRRLRRGFTWVPPMRALGEANDPALAEQVGYLLGSELRAVGIDVDYAPVLDVDTNPDNPVIGQRSFSRDPHVVARLGVALARGLEAAGVASCGKHFPGHGDTSQDSHRELPRLPHDLSRLEAVELVPFRAAIAAGMPSLMTAHVVFEALDSEYPATMSSRVLNGMLRGTLGYRGLVVTDDLEMKAIADHYGYEEAAIRGLEAGVDAFLCCHTASVAHRIIDGLAQAVASGRVSAERLTEAAERVRHFTERWARPPEAPRLDVLRRDEHLACVERVLENVDTRFLALGRDPTEIRQELDKRGEPPQPSRSRDPLRGS